jgi:hypothetical protein
MRYIKHFVKVAKGYLARIRCKHEETYSATCPFNRITYVYCKKCLKNTRIENVA